MSAPTKPEDCPTPGYHDTHRYCLSCTWGEETLRERMEQHGPLVYTKNMGADEPVFHAVVEHDDGILNARCEPDNRAIHYWGTLHVKHASRIGTACEVCFPPMGR